MTLTSTAVAPTVSGNGGNVGAPTFQNFVMTYPMAASASISKGDFIKLADTAANTVSKMTATTDTFLGIANVNIDNTYKSDGVTAGAAGDKYVSVIRKGFAEVNGRVSASGPYDEPILINSPMYVCSGTITTTDNGQCLTSTTHTGIGTKIVARSIDAVAAQTTTGLFKISVYIDTLTNNLV